MGKSHGVPPLDEEIQEINKHREGELISIIRGWAPWLVIQYRVLALETYTTLSRLRRLGLYVDSFIWRSGE